MIKLVRIFLGLLLITGTASAQVVCTDFTITGTTVTGYVPSQGAGCALSPRFLLGNTNLD
jgi:hypothetical protein